MKRDKNEIIAQIAFSDEDRVTLARVWDKYSESQRKNIPAATQFLNEREQALAAALIKTAGFEAKYVFWGGYPGAERAQAVFLPDYTDAEEAPEYANITLLRAEFPKEIALSHRDFLGAIMGAGVKREATGDMLVSEGKCDIAAATEIAQFLIQSLESAGRARLSVHEIGRDEIEVPEKKYREIKDTVASMRLDSIVASGFGMARGKASELIKSGRVSLNFIECAKPDREVAQGDVVSARGFGRLEIEEVGGTTKKGRISVKLRRLV